MTTSCSAELHVSIITTQRVEAAPTQRRAQSGESVDSDPIRSELSVINVQTGC